MYLKFLYQCLMTALSLVFPFLLNVSGNTCVDITTTAGLSVKGVLNVTRYLPASCLKTEKFPEPLRIEPSVSM